LTDCRHDFGVRCKRIPFFHRLFCFEVAIFFLSLPAPTDPPGARYLRASAVVSREGHVFFRSLASSLYYPFRTFHLPFLHSRPPFGPPFGSLLIPQKLTTGAPFPRGRFFSFFRSERQHVYNAILSSPVTGIFSPPQCRLQRRLYVCPTSSPPWLFVHGAEEIAPFFFFFSFFLS